MVNNKLKDTPDIFIGIVSFVGIDTRPVISALAKDFEAFGYQPVPIKISGAFPDFDKTLSLHMLDDVSEKDRTEKYIEFGNEIRKKFDNNDFWAQYAISEIGGEKDNEAADEDKPKAYIINQLKTEDELNLLKSVYGKAFFQLSIYSARDRRVDYLAKYKAKAERKRDPNPYRSEAEKLVNRDYDEKLKHGQQVGKIFSLADVIINIDDKEAHPVEKQIERFVELLFGSNTYSPNPMEYGMYMAHSAALRSLDLSRQVGAAIFRCSGEVAALGCNEVPKAGGGTYWADATYDAREYKKGSDSNDTRKKELLAELEAILETSCSEEHKGTLRKIIDDNKKPLEDSQFMDALEYGRIVHAEMNAVTDAARLGISLKGATLYCTTFPCHMCAKHIIAAGLKRVVFLEPYPKSLTADLHPDSAQIEGASREGYQSYPAVVFTHFFGITAQRYYEFFHRGKRKDKDSEFQDYIGGRPRPIFAPYQIDSDMENETMGEFIKKLSSPAGPAGAITESSETLLRRARFWRKVRAGKRLRGSKGSRPDR